jgi:hypothetical protein
MQFPSQFYMGKDPHEGSFMKGVFLFVVGLVIGAALVFLGIQGRYESFRARTEAAAEERWRRYYSSPASPPPRFDDTKPSPMPPETAGPVPPE